MNEILDIIDCIMCNIILPSLALCLIALGLLAIKRKK
jgi:hypothetical protein